MSRQACLELARALGLDPDALVEEWAERAAIRELDGGQPREVAEREALGDVSARHRKGPRSAVPEVARATKSSSS